MKRLIPTLLLVIICIGGFWYASSKDFFKEKKAPSASLAKVNKDEVTGYSIKTADSEIELQHKDGTWTMTKPSALPLSDYSTSSWVDSFNALTKDKTVDANASDLAQFGLDKPSQQFKVTLQNGTVHTLSIGSPVAIQGFSYAMFSGSPEVFQVSDSSVKPLAMAPIDFMEKSPVKLDYEQVRSLSLDWKGQKWTLTKTDTDIKSYEADWKLNDQTLKGADASQYLDKVQFLNTEQPAKRTAEIKTDMPELRLEVKSADTSNKETTSVYLGKAEQDNVWVWQEGGEWAYSLPAASIQELADKPKQPQDGAASAQPQAGGAMAQPQDGTAPAQPQAGGVMTQPQAQPQP